MRRRCYALVAIESLLQRNAESVVVVGNLYIDFGGGKRGFALIKDT